MESTMMRIRCIEPSSTDMSLNTNTATLSSCSILELCLCSKQSNLDQVPTWPTTLCKCTRLAIFQSTHLPHRDWDVLPNSSVRHQLTNQDFTLLPTHLYPGLPRVKYLLAIQTFIMHLAQSTKSWTCNVLNSTFYWVTPPLARPSEGCYTTGQQMIHHQTKHYTYFDAS